MLQKNTALNVIEITSNGTVQIRFAKQIVDADEVIASQWHRTSIFPGADIKRQISEVNNHLGMMGYPSVADEDVIKINNQAKAAWTPEIIRAYQSNINEN